jgi:serine/threonine protein kinase
VSTKPLVDQPPERWARVRRALEESVGTVDPAGSLRSALGGEPELLALALDLLEHDEGERSPETPLARRATSTGHGGAGLVIGPWVTQRVLGVGGMGTVHLAVRADGAFRRKVALKLIRPHLASEEVLARFRRERQVQANLEHPGIVRMLDGGATEDGAPYFVMEYVEGVRIDEYCDEHRLTVRERVALFTRVALAVEYAHRQLVVHRDLKPSNILVTADGAPKLLDFGIAKVLDREKLSAGGEVTADVMGFLTPAYTSPEQLRGRSATVASDIYSLGVLLYLLLTGRAPYDLGGLTPAEIERLVADDDPARPSDVVLAVHEIALQERRETTRLTPELVAQRRCAMPSEVRRALRGDLDRIVLHCMHKEPQRRYASAAALAEDLERHLAGRPILARPDSLGYRVQKFLRRNRGPVAAAALVIALLAGGLVHTLDQNADIVFAHGEALAQRDVADERLAALRSLRRRFVGELDRVLLSVPGALQSSERLLQVVVEYLDVEADAAGDDLALLGEIGETYGTLGRVYFGGRGAHLGQSDKALACHERARAALERAHELAPEDLGVARRLSRVHEELSALHIEAGDLGAALASLDVALGVLGQGPRPKRAAHPKLLLVAAPIHEAESRCLQAAGRLPEAIAAIDAASAAWNGAIEHEPTLAVFLRGQLAVVRVRRAELARQVGEPERALELLDEAGPWLRAVLESHGALATGDVHWIMYCRARARTLDALADPRAADAFRELLLHSRGLSERGPGDVRAQLDLVSALTEVAEHVATTGQPGEALTFGAEALALATDMHAERPSSAATRSSLARAEVAQGELLLATGSRLAAAEALLSGSRRAEALAEEDPAAYYVREVLARALLACGRLHRSEADMVKAESAEARRKALEESQSAYARARELAERDRAAGLGGAWLERCEREARDGYDSCRAALQ